MKNRKGQTAMEYLMTYGWAILIILVVGGVLYYYGVFSPSTLVGKSKTGFSSVDVVDYTLTASDDSLNLLLENRAGTDINITGIEVDGNSNAISPEITLGAGDRTDSFVTATTTGLDVDSGDAYQLEGVVIQYERLDAPGQTLSSSGTLAGKAG
ncbi:MAG: hypothetical protein ABEK36_03830 [Candidatus Aenigmatarchaeota archaeon]